MKAFLIALLLVSIYALSLEAQHEIAVQKH